MQRLRISSDRFSRSRRGIAGDEERVKGEICEEADLEANFYNLSEIGGGGEILAAGAKVGEAQVTRAGELKA